MKKFANEIMENMAKQLNVFQKEKKSASFIKQLIKMANHYDKKGMEKIADHIDDLLYVFSKTAKTISDSLEEPNEEKIEEVFKKEKQDPIKKNVQLDLPIEDAIKEREKIEEEVAQKDSREIGKFFDKIKSFAKRAYEKALESGPSDDTRKYACLDPEYACKYAFEVDKESREDTREAACKEPLWAFAYAMFVDEGPGDVTRNAACLNPEWALKYAVEIDKRGRLDTYKAVENSEYEQEYKQTFGMR